MNKIVKIKPFTKNHKNMMISPKKRSISIKSQELWNNLNKRLILRHCRIYFINLRNSSRTHLQFNQEIKEHKVKESFEDLNKKDFSPNKIKENSEKDPSSIVTNKEPASD